MLLKWVCSHTKCICQINFKIYIILFFFTIFVKQNSVLLYYTVDNMNTYLNNTIPISPEIFI